MVRSAGLTDRGLARTVNQDAFVADNGLQFYLVADGIGGHAAGDVASSTVAESVLDFVRRSQHDEDCPWPFGVDPALSRAGNRLRTGILLANRRLLRMAEGVDEYQGMGSTVVCALLAEGRLVVAHAGDSRLYLAADGQLMQLTEDDSWLSALRARGLETDPERLLKHPMRNVLTNVLGVRDEVVVHLLELDILPGELVLMCSDGLHGVVSEDVVTSLLSTEDDLDVLNKLLLQAALDAGAPDNVTTLLVRYLGERPVDTQVIWR